MIVYGKQVFLYILKRHSHLIRGIYLAKEVEKELFREISQLSLGVIRVDPKRAQAMAKGGNHQGFLLEIEPPLAISIGELKGFSRLLVLCGVSDAGNIGGIFRSAHCLGCNGIVISGVSSFSLEGVIRTSSGALLEIPYALVKNPLDVASELHDCGFVLYGASAGGESHASVEFARKSALFMGSEGEGLNKRLLSKMDKVLGIQMSSGFDSLNVGVAAAIIMDRMRDGRGN
ncbi:MAG: 23S rRNA (guanosine(2251)-2'-O)-methyltransferase RlmB [Wolinella sp.]